MEFSTAFEFLEDRSIARVHHVQWARLKAALYQVPTQILPSDQLKLISNTYYPIRVANTATTGEARTGRLRPVAYESD